MYTPVKISQLSKQQISRLLNGHTIRVMPDSQGRHVVNVNKEQLKKITRAHTRGGALNITFDPYQIDTHHYLRGEGIGQFFKKAGKTLKKAFTSKVGKQIQKSVVKAGLDLAQSSGYIDPVSRTVVQNLANRGIEAEGIRDVYRKVKPHFKKVAKRAAPHVSKFLKEEIRRAAPQVVQHASHALVPYVGESNAQQLGEFAGKQMTDLGERAVTHYTGYGVKKRGGALYPAGY